MVDASRSDATAARARSAVRLRAFCIARLHESFGFMRRFCYALFAHTE